MMKTRRISEGARLLWEAIEQAGLTQGKTEKILGWKKGRLNPILHGVRQPSLLSMRLFRDTFNVPLESWEIPTALHPKYEPIPIDLSPDESGVFIRNNGELIRVVGGEELDR